MEIDVSKLKVMGDRVIIDPILPKDKKTSGGIIIPDAVSENTNQGHVLAIGDKVKAEITVGDIVMFNNFTATKISTGLDEKGDPKYVLMVKESELWCVIEE